MQLTPATSTSGAGRLLPAGSVRAGSCLPAQGNDDALSPRRRCPGAHVPSPAAHGWGPLRCSGSGELCERGPAASSAPPVCTRCRFGPLALPVPGTVQSSTRSYRGHCAGSSASPAGPPGRSRGPSKCILMLPQEQPLGSPRLSAAPSLQLVRSAGFLLPRYGFGFNNS